jgi:hypothetical protein
MLNSSATVSFRRRAIFIYLTIQDTEHTLWGSPYTLHFPLPFQSPPPPSQNIRIIITFSITLGLD